ncbi:hypothetical protein [Duganella sp. BuS-21]|uniref:hypothetical protein n=1 Tax=Duganella sp. BuS-21 TaxID=2943848 RepID=UPI0035A67C70
MKRFLSLKAGVAGRKFKGKFSIERIAELLHILGRKRTGITPKALHFKKARHEEVKVIIQQREVSSKPQSITRDINGAIISRPKVPLYRASESYASRNKGKALKATTVNTELPLDLVE